MTAELVAMNGNAVAMAADSAVTLSRGDQQVQTYFSANKLFSLSYDHPVGIMLYQGSSMHSVPWETIIKIYRKKIGSNTFDRLENYAQDFIDFLISEQGTLFPEELQRKELQDSSERFLFGFQNLIAQKWSESNKKGDMTKKFINGVITEFHDKKNAEAIESWMDEAQQKKVLDFISKTLKDLEFPIIRDTYKKNVSILAELVLDFLLTSHSFGYTGLVFAGFGEDDIFPSAFSFKVCGLYLGKLRIEEQSHSKIEHGNQATVIPFAQTDMAKIFMEGISSIHEDAIRNTFLDRIIHIPSETIDEISDLSDEQKITWKDYFLEKSEKAAIEMMDNLSGHIFESHTRTIIEGLRHLSKDELADVAESIISLSTLHKKVSPGDDTVGGPVDSAVISKGDGFVWINRKHYFKPELNPHFFTRYSGFSGKIKDDTKK